VQNVLYMPLYKTKAALNTLPCSLQVKHTPGEASATMVCLEPNGS